MALETLRDYGVIGSTGVNHIVDGKLTGYYSDPDTMSRYICIDHDENEITFRIQNGPIKEVGENGCQVDDIIIAASLIIEGLNMKFPCVENVGAIDILRSAVNSLAERKKNREMRGVEGKSEK